MRIRRYLFLIVMFLGASTASLASDCVRRIAAKGPSPRTVALAGGDGWILLRDYLSAAKERDVDISPWKLQVVLQMKGKQETLQLGWGKMLTGESAEKLWERSLSGKRAEPSTELLAQARSGNWDVVCVGAKSIPIEKPVPVPDHVPPVLNGDALIYFKSGVQYAAGRDYGNALKEFKEAEKRNRNFPGLLMNIGVAYMQLKDYVRAADYLTRAVSQDPRDPATRLNMACLQARLGQREDAIASLAAAKAGGMKMTASLRNDPDLAALRGRKEFEALFRPAAEKP